MAVVSISRIQVRRGTALQGTGLPQLASGEFGWAIDTQELYIGNGSTAEGAPAVGNTRILTERTNVLELAGQYTYLEEGRAANSIDGTVNRSLASRLDDRVSVRAFGVFANTSGPAVTQQLQKALYELYLSNSESRYVLHVEPGVFDITQTIYVPPFTTIIGAGKDLTVFRKNGSYPMFETISSDSFYDGVLSGALPQPEPEFLEENQARGVRIEHLTLETTSNSIGTKVALLKLQSTKDSTFKHVKFKGPKTTGDSDEVAIEFISKSNLVRTRDNQFVNCDFVGLGYAGYSSSNVTNNVLERCKLRYLKNGITLGDALEVGQSGPQDNVITLSTFDDIDEYAFLVPEGTKNASVKNTYGRSVGNAGGSADVTLYPIISYGERGNLSIDDVFNRTRRLATESTLIAGGTTAAPYYPEVEGPCFFTWGFYEEFTVNNAGVNSPLLSFRLPADTTKNYKIEYFYKSDDPLNPTRNFTREGELDVYVNRDNNEVKITDDYETSGNPAFNENIKFTGIVDFALDSANNQVYTANIFIENPGDEGPMTIKVTSKS